MTKRRTMLFLAAALTYTACGDGTAPAPLPHSYDLVRVDDQPLPATPFLVTMPATTPGGTEATCADRVLSRRLELGRGGRYTVTNSSLLVCDDGRPDVKSVATSGGTYMLSKDQLTLTSDMSSTPWGVTQWLGTRTGLELSLQQQMPPSGPYGSGYGDFIMDYHTYFYRAVR